MVFFVLGCDVEQTGAIDWAAAAPNLLNVAVTRAKSYLYVIGDCHLWGGRQYFDMALALLAESPRQVGKPAPADADIHAG